VQIRRLETLDEDDELLIELLIQRVIHQLQIHRLRVAADLRLLMMKHKILLALDLYYRTDYQTHEQYYNIFLKNLQSDDWRFLSIDTVDFLCYFLFGTQM
jgi:hypothetical protein